MTPDLIKLVLLQSNMSVSEGEKGDSRWIYVQKSELERVIKEGHGEAYGYVNQNTNLCRLRFDLDASNNLVIKDIANRSVLLAMVTKQGLDESLYQNWLTKADQAMAQLTHAEHHLRKVRLKFHDALPHSFIDPELPTAMQATLHELQQQLDATQVECERNVMRIRNLNQFFA
ncbi:MoxR-like ATPase [Vibrio cholerae]|nr:hypothetical protein VCSRO8_2563 [Vibrio cholerae]CSC56042.1 MoxR-like ATPase [Vibrio cholerae]CSI65574.1 MoxR-like ATPase [Vibrio cholerae]